MTTTVPATKAQAVRQADTVGKRAFRARLDTLRFNRATTDKAAAGVRTFLRKTRLDAVTTRIAGAGRWLLARIRPVITRVQSFVSAVGRPGIFAAAISAATTAAGRSMVRTAAATVLKPVSWLARQILGATSWMLNHLGAPGQAADRMLGTAVLKVASVGYRVKLQLSGGIIGRNLAVDSETMRVAAGLANGVLVWRVASAAITAAGFPLNTLGRILEIGLLATWSFRVLYTRSWTARVVVNKVRRQVQPLPVIVDEAITDVADDAQRQAAASHQAAPTTEKASMEHAASKFLDEIQVVAKASRRTVADLLKESDNYIADLIQANEQHANGKHNGGKNKATPAQVHKARERSPEAAAKR